MADPEIRPLFTEPTAQDVVIVRETDGGSYFIRFEISTNGSVVKKTYNLVRSAVVKASSGQVESQLWQLADTTPYPSITADIVRILLKAKWLTAKEKEENKDKIKPITIVPDQPACDGSEGFIKLKNITTGEFEAIYKFTPNCGEIDLFKFSEKLTTQTIRSVFQVIDNLKIIDTF